MTNKEILENLNELSRNTLTKLVALKRVRGAVRLLRASDVTFDVYLGAETGRMYAKMPNGDLWRAE